MTSPRELIGEVNDAIARSDLDAVSQRVHRDLVWEQNLGRGSPEEGVYQGRDSVIALFERILEPWEYTRLFPHDIQLREDGSYLVRGEMRSKHATSAAEVVTLFEQRLEFRDGLLVKGSMTMGEIG